MRGRGRERGGKGAATRPVAASGSIQSAPHDDGWKNEQGNATRRRAVLDVLSGGRSGAQQQFGLIPFMPEDNHVVSPATLMMTHDLETVLRCKSEYFWSMVEYEPSLLDMVNAYVRYSDEEQPHDALSQHVLAFFCRLVMDPPSGNAASVHIRTLRRRGWLDFPKLIDLVTVYSARAFAVVSRTERLQLLNTIRILSRALFTEEPAFQEDWVKTVLLASKPLTQLIPERALKLMTGAQSSSEDLIPEVTDNILYMFNITWTLLTLIRSYAPLLDALFSEQPLLVVDIFLAINACYNLVLPVLAYSAAGQLVGRVRKAVLRAKHSILLLSQQIIPKMIKLTQLYPSFAKAFLVAAAGADFRRLEKHANTLSPELSPWMNQCLPVLMQLSAAAPYGSMSPTCWASLATECRVDFSQILSYDPKLLEIYLSLSAEVSGVSSEPANWHVALVKAKSVVELLPDISTGWAALALVQPQFNLDHEKLVNALFEVGADTTHTNLPASVRGLSKSAPIDKALAHWRTLRGETAAPSIISSTSLEESPLHNRRSVFDGDEFDILRRGEIAPDTTHRVVVGKREDDWRTILNDKSDVRAQKAAILAKYEYEDEPDDSMDDFQPFGVQDADTDSSSVLRRNVNHRLMETVAVDEEEEEEEGEDEEQDDRQTDLSPPTQAQSGLHQISSRGGFGTQAKPMQPRGGGGARGGRGHRHPKTRGTGLMDTTRHDTVSTHGQEGASAVPSSSTGNNNNFRGARRGRGAPKNHDRKQQAAQKQRT